MKTILMSLLLMLSAESALARDSWSYGSGTTSCGNWVSFRKVEMLTGNPQWTSDFSQWTLGYISAYSHFGGTPLRRTDRAAIEVWLDQYCVQNPLQAIMAADNALIEALRE